MLKGVYGQDLLGVYLFGSLIVGGLQRYSDIDMFVVVDRPTVYEERTKLVADLLKISGIYQRSSKPPIEMTVVVKSEINPWHYPPKFDFQYGDWLRPTFESGQVDPGTDKKMPDLALLITQVLLANKILYGLSPDKLLGKVPYSDFLAATKNALSNLALDLHNDTRNALLTYARIWRTVETDTLCSKTDAAFWVINRLPEIYKPVMKHAYATCIGDENEHWNDLAVLIQPAADYMIKQIDNMITLIESSDHANRSIKNTSALHDYNYNLIPENHDEI